MKTHLFTFFLIIAALILAVTAPGCGCGGKADEGAAVKVFFCDFGTSFEHPNMTYYLSVLDENRKSVFESSAITDEKGMALFDGLPSHGKYTLRFWNMDNHTCELPQVDLSNFAGDKRGSLAGRCEQ